MIPDVVTDQTPAHDVLMYVPAGLSVAAADELREATRRNTSGARWSRWRSMSRPCWTSSAAGAEVFDYGNNLRQRAFDYGVTDAFEFPGFVPAYIRPLFCEGKGPFRWVALSGDPEDIYRTDEAVMELFPEDEHLHRWLKMAREKVPFQGLPARICWLGYGERAKAGSEIQRAGAQRDRQSADRDRARSPGCRLGGLPQPRDGRRCGTARTRSATGRS